MKCLQRVLLILMIGTALTGTTWAVKKTVVLDVAGMTCAACPITVKKALNKVPGVSNVQVNYPKKQAIVTFDDSKTNTQGLIKATANAGYPSKLESAHK